MEPARTTRSTTKRLPAQRTTRNSAKTPPYIYTPLSRSSAASTTGAHSRKTATRTQQRIAIKTRKSANTKPKLLNATCCNDDVDDDDVIESSQEPAESTTTNVEFIIERDTCQMSPLLFDSDSDSDPYASHNTVPIPNNQQANQTPHTINRTERHAANNNAVEDKISSFSEPLIDLPTSTTETDTDLSQQTHAHRTEPLSVNRRRASFRSFKCTPARLTRLTALRNSAAPPVTTARMDPPRLSAGPDSRAAGVPVKYPHSKRVRPLQPSSSSEFSVASDISTIMTARRNVINGESDDILNAVRVEPYEPCTAMPPTNDSLPRQLNNLRRRDPSTSQELQLVEHKSVIISLSSSTDDTHTDADVTTRHPVTSGCQTQRTAFGSALSQQHQRRSPDLFDTYDDDCDALPTLPRRTNSWFFERPRPSFFARLRAQAAAATVQSAQRHSSAQKRRRTPPSPRGSAVTEQQRRDESIDIFGDNATFIETCRPAQLQTEGDDTVATTTHLSPPTGIANEDDVGQQNNSITNTTSVFEITKNDVFPHVIRLNSESDMSPIKMSDDEYPPASRFKLLTPAAKATAAGTASASTSTKPKFIDPDVLNTGIIPSSQLDGAHQQLERTPPKLTLYERLCRTDPSRQFGSRRRRKTTPRAPPNGSQSVIRTPDRRRRKSVSRAAATVAGTSGSGSPDLKRGRRLQKWGSDERTKAPWSGRRLDDYFAKASTSTAATAAAAATARNETANSTADRKVATTKPMESFQLLVLSSEDDER